MRKLIKVCVGMLIVSIVATLCSCGQSAPILNSTQNNEGEQSSSQVTETDSYETAIKNLIDLRIKGITDHAADVLPPEAYSVWLEENQSLEEGLEVYADIAEDYREMTKDGGGVTYTIISEKDLGGSYRQNTVDGLINNWNVKEDSIEKLLEIELSMTLADMSETMTICVAKINGKWYPLLPDENFYEFVL